MASTKLAYPPPLLPPGASNLWAAAAGGADSPEAADVTFLTPDTNSPHASAVVASPDVAAPSAAALDAAAAPAAGTGRGAGSGGRGPRGPTGGGSASSSRSSGVVEPPSLSLAASAPTLPMLETPLKLVTAPAANPRLPSLSVATLSPDAAAAVPIDATISSNVGVGDREPGTMPAMLLW